MDLHDPDGFVLLEKDQQQVFALRRFDLEGDFGLLHGSLPEVERGPVAQRCLERPRDKGQRDLDLHLLASAPGAVDWRFPVIEIEAGDAELHGGHLFRGAVLSEEGKTGE